MTRVLFIQGGGESAYSLDLALAASLGRALGARYDVHCPRMPNEAEPDLNAWKKTISSELSRIEEALVVAHSLGGATLLRCFADDGIAASIAGAFMLAAPAWDGDRWNFEALKLPADIGKTLAPISKLFFYHCRDDDTVPFAHLALHRSRIPRAVTRAFDSGGHQFAGQVSSIAADIRVAHRPGVAQRDPRLSDF